MHCSVEFLPLFDIMFYFGLLTILFSFILVFFTEHFGLSLLIVAVGCLFSASSIVIESKIIKCTIKKCNLDKTEVRVILCERGSQGFLDYLKEKGCYVKDKNKRNGGVK